MRIGVDLDDVLVDFMGEFTNICHDLFGKPEIGTKAVDWEWSNFGLTQDQFDQAWTKVKSVYDFWTDLEVEDGVSKDRLSALAWQHELFFITARVASKGASVQWQSSWWVEHNIGILYPTVLVSYDKGPLAAALKLDYFIDDRPKNCLEIKQAVPTCKVCLKDSSHNQTFSHPEIVRVQDMNEFMDIVEAECKMQ